VVAEPFTPREIVVKALTLALKRRLASAQPAAAMLEPSPETDAAPKAPAPPICQNGSGESRIQPPVEPPPSTAQLARIPDVEARVKTLQEKLAAKDAALEDEQSLRRNLTGKFNELTALKEQLDQRLLEQDALYRNSRPPKIRPTRPRATQPAR